MTQSKQFHLAVDQKKFIRNYTAIGSSPKDKAHLTKSLFLVGIFNFYLIQNSPLGSDNEYLFISMIPITV